MGRNVLTVDRANLNGDLFFNLRAATLNDPATTLLRILPGGGSSANYADLSGATVRLSNFGSGADRSLYPGDEFYLIDTSNPTGGNLDGNPTNNIAYARQGLTRGYYFTVDKNPTKNALSGIQNRMLVARLLNGVPIASHEARILTEGRSASLAVLGQSADWLADHSYQQADLALRRGENRGVFGGIDGSSIHANTGARIKMHGNMVLAGVAGKHERADSSFLLGGYFEGGYADYNIRGKFGHPDHPGMKGKGNLRYYGVGLMARQRWDNGFRIEGSARVGRLENRFRSRDFSDASGAYAKYDLHTAYFGAHLGVGYEWQVNEHSRLDFLARYYWARQNGKTVPVSSDKSERVKFKGDNSHRARIGSRYTYVKDEWHSYYVGLAYEYEFDNRTRASSYGNDFDVPSLKGSSGVGEIGMIIYPRDNERLSIECGLQGYTGKREGVSGGIRVGWKF
jgi:outer membrane autotransporter protein